MSFFFFFLRTWTVTVISRNRFKFVCKIFIDGEYIVHSKHGQMDIVITIFSEWHWMAEMKYCHELKFLLYIYFLKSNITATSLQVNHVNEWKVSVMSAKLNHIPSNTPPPHTHIHPHKFSKHYVAMHQCNSFLIRQTRSKISKHKKR